MHLVSRAAAPFDDVWAWSVIRAFADLARAGRAPATRAGFDWDDERGLVPVPAERAELVVDPCSEPCLNSALRLTPSVRQLFELYLPLCIGPSAATLVLGHVGQSLDGQIATAAGASRYVTGPENIVHMHRLRSLVDAVIVGAGTVLADDPELTTRLVPGPHATRVVIDPTLRLPGARKLFQGSAAKTLIACARSAVPTAAAAHVERVPVGVEDGRLRLPELLAALSARGLRRVFVEGGGVTISRFIEADCLDRLHVTICPILIGRGRPGISLAGVERLEQARRPRARRFTLGEDVLFDCQMRLR